MNIFFLDEDPIIAAKAMTNKHVVKMIVESAQLLCTAHRVLDGNPFKRRGLQITYHLDDSSKEAIFYKSTHPNHPSAIWVRESESNYHWLYRHFLALCNEFTHRYMKVHKTEQKLGLLLENAPASIQVGELTTPALVMPDIYKVEGNAPVSYRNYYEAEKLKSSEDWQRYTLILKLQRI